MCTGEEATFALGWRRMKRTLVLSISLFVGAFCVSCSGPGISLSPLTEQERQDLGTIGIASEMSALDAMHRHSTPWFSDEARELRDRFVDIGNGALDGGAKANIFGSIASHCYRGEACLFVHAAALTPVAIGAIAGGVYGALHRQTYSGPPQLEHPSRATYEAVEDSIDALGLPDKLRDKIWEQVQGYQLHKFYLVSKLPLNPLQGIDEYGRRTEWARYWPLRDKGIQTVLKVRIPFVEFHGSDIDHPYELRIPVETTLFKTNDRSCVRQRIWEYRGASHSLIEWNKDEAQLFVLELERFIDAVAKRVSPTFFSKESDSYPKEASIVIPQSESHTCLG